jgi:hypothetical protein
MAGAPGTPRSNVDASSREVRLAAAAARVRALMRAVEEPLDLLVRIDGAARLHLDALTPDLAVLEAQPFAALPDIVFETPAGEVMPRSARAPESFPVRPPARAPRVSQAAAVSQAFSATASAIARAAAHTRDAREPLHATMNRRAPSEPAATRTPPFVLPVGGFSSHARTARAGAITLRDPATVRRGVLELGAIHERTTRHDTVLPVTKARPARSTGLARAAKSATIFDPPEEQVPRAARHSVLHPARPSGVSRPAVTVFRLNPARVRPELQPGLAGHTGQGDVNAPPSDLPAAGPASKPAAAAARSAWRFYLDPLEPRAHADGSDDDLADRITDVLREQARRQGVDLT